MPGEAGGAARAWRRLARLLIGRNKLRRPSDRIEGAVVLLLSAAFLAAVLAAPLFGAAIYHSQRAAAARMHPAVAVLTQNGPYDGGVTGDGQAMARWPVPGGQQGSGLLTTQTAPGIWGASAGTRVRIWLTASGVPGRTASRRHRGAVHRDRHRDLRGLRGRDRADPLLLAVPPGTRPAPASRVGIRLGPDRPALDHPPLNAPRGRRVTGHPPWRSRCA